MSQHEIFKRLENPLPLESNGPIRNNPIYHQKDGNGNIFIVIDRHNHIGPHRSTGGICCYDLDKRK